MVTIVPVSVEGGVSRGMQGSSHDVLSTGCVYGHQPHCHPRGSRGHRSSPSRFVHRHHSHHHHHHHLKGPYGMLAYRHCRSDVSHGGRKHHGGPDHGLRRRHVSRGLHEVAVPEHGPHYWRRMHRSLSPDHLMHNRSSDGSRGAHRGHRGHPRHCGRGPHDVNFHVVAFREHHFRFDSEDPNSGSESDRSFPLPVAIEQGIEQLGQLTIAEV